jgi:DNA-binding transcriptional LysR family regulator
MLDHLRAFLAVVEEGSFSAASRRLGRVQSGVSSAMAKLEEQLGLALFDRATKVPRLTDQGRVVVAAARRICAEVDALRQLAASLVTGVEPSISLCVDTLFPPAGLVELGRELAGELPTVDLRVDTRSVASVAARVLEGSASLGVTSLPGLPPGLERRLLAPIAMVPVVAAGHALAAEPAPIPTARFAEAVQIVLSERQDAVDQHALSPRTWHIADLHTALELVRGGLAWANLPEHLVADDLRAGQLVGLQPQAWSDAERRVNLFAVHRGDATLGPAHRWMLERLGHLSINTDGSATSPWAALLDVGSVRRLVRDTLGCQCPDEVFDDVVVGRPSVFADAGASSTVQLLVGRRLLVSLVELERLQDVRADAERLLREGREVRDAHGLNRFRLVLVGRCEAALVEALATTAASLDERLHVHAVEPAALLRLAR